MELKEYLKVFKKYLIFILVLSLFGAILAFKSIDFLPSGYNVVQTLYLAAPEVPSSQYNYEGFYAQEKARNATDTAVAILESPDFKTSFVKREEVLKIRKLAPQVIKITVVSENAARSQELSLQTVNNFNQKFEELTGASGNLSLKPISPIPEATFTKSNQKIYALAGLLLGFTAAVFIISLKEYFKL